MELQPPAKLLLRSATTRFFTLAADRRAGMRSDRHVAIMALPLSLLRPPQVFSQEFEGSHAMNRVRTVEELDSRVIR
jgi:hypothetical protein